MSDFPVSRRALAMALPLSLVSTAVMAKAKKRQAANHAGTGLPPRGSRDLRFGLDLIAELFAAKPGNICVSPTGIAATFAALDLGADGPLRAAMGRTLRIEGDPAKAFASLRADGRLLAVEAGKPDAPLATASAVFVDRSLDLKPAMVDRAEAEGAIRLRSIDFSAADAVGTVNQWAADQTHGRIGDILSAGEKAELMAVHALHFKAKWATPFLADQTATAPFQRLDGSSTDRPTMVSSDMRARAATSGAFDAIELDYTASGYTMVLVTARDKPATPADFRTVLPLVSGGGLPERLVRLSLPKFSLTDAQDLIRPLAALGLAPGLQAATQLSGFADGLKLTDVRQKLMIDVDEQGTEAAAVTVAMASRALDADNQLLVLKFDKPFIYALQHRPTGAILMMGYVADPLGTK